MLYLKEEQDKKKVKSEKKKEVNQNQNNKNSILISGLNSNIVVYDLIPNNNQNNANKNKNRTRNIVSNCFYNNPNTKIKKNLNKSNNHHLSIGLSYNDKKRASNCLWFILSPITIICSNYYLYYFNYFLSSKSYV